MNDQENIYTTSENGTPGTPRWVGIAVATLAIVSIVALGIGWNASTQARNAERDFAAQNKTAQHKADDLGQRLSQEEQANAALQSELDGVTGRLKTAQGDLTSTRRQTTQIRDEYSRKMDNVQTELSSKASEDDVKSIASDVNGVKTDLAATDNNLQMSRGEFGTLIAKNHDEIDQLRRLGERDYYEFTLDKGNRAKVGTLGMELRNTNAKKGQFTVALYVDDMRLEKKNRSVDEPIYFYTRGTKTPLEMVINTVDKDKVVGYLSIPKDMGALVSSASAAH